MTAKLLRLLAITLLLPSVLLAQDQIEFLNGTKLTGTVQRIDKAERKIQFASKIGTQTSTRTYSYGQIHAVLYRGKRYVLTAKPAQAQQARVERTAAEVDRIINTVGSTDPDWLAPTRLNFPRSLDMNWPTAPNKVWNNQKFPGHYVWDVINPEPGKWKEGVKLMYHMIQANRSNRNAQNKAMNQLGALYASLFEDWPRAAYWFRKAGSGTSGSKGQGGYRFGIENGLAKCYYRLGNKEMAMKVLGRAQHSNPYLLCEMGEHDRAIAQANKARRRWGDGALITLGDISRHAGRYDQAIAYYEEATRLAPGKKYDHAIRKGKERLASTKIERGLDLSRLRNGTHRGQAVGYTGPLHVAVSVRNNRIASVQVTQHTEKQYYASLTEIPAQIIRKQTIKGIDASSSATITSEAIVRAVVDALGD